MAVLQPLMVHSCRLPSDVNVPFTPLQLDLRNVRDHRSTSAVYNSSGSRRRSSHNDASWHNGRSLHVHPHCETSRTHYGHLTQRGLCASTVVAPTSKQPFSPDQVSREHLSQSFYNHVVTPSHNPSARQQPVCDSLATSSVNDFKHKKGRTTYRSGHSPSLFDRALQGSRVQAVDTTTRTYTHELLTILFLLKRFATLPHCSTTLDILKRGTASPSWASAELDSLIREAQNAGDTLFTQLEPVTLALVAQYSTSSTDTQSYPEPSPTVSSPLATQVPQPSPIELVPFPGGCLFNVLEASTAGSNNALVHGVAYTRAQTQVDLLNGVKVRRRTSSSPNSWASSKPLLNPIAVKVLKKEHIQRQGPIAEKRCLEEIRIALRAAHSSVVKTFQVFEAHQLIYLVMEYANRGDLVNLIRNYGALSEHDARHIFSQMLDGLIYLHDHNIAHRDLKPENVLLHAPSSLGYAESRTTTPGKRPRSPLTKWRVLVADFGAAIDLQTEPNQVLTDTLGTLAYAAPEILGGKPYTGEAVDVWSLGVVLFAMIFGKLPWNIQDSTLESAYNIIMTQPLDIPREGRHPRTVSNECRDLIHQMIVIDPSSRRALRDIPNHPWLQNDVGNNRLQRLGVEYCLPHRKQTSCSFRKLHTEKLFDLPEFEDCNSGNYTTRNELPSKPYDWLLHLTERKSFLGARAQQRPALTTSPALQQPEASITLENVAETECHNEQPTRNRQLQRVFPTPATRPPKKAPPHWVLRNTDPQHYTGKSTSDIVTSTASKSAQQRSAGEVVLCRTGRWRKTSSIHLHLKQRITAEQPYEGKTVTKPSTCLSESDKFTNKCQPSRPRTRTGRHNWIDIPQMTRHSSKLMKQRHFPDKERQRPVHSHERYAEGRKTTAENSGPRAEEAVDVNVQPSDRPSCNPSPVEVRMVRRGIQLPSIPPLSCKGDPSDDCATDRDTFPTTEGVTVNNAYLFSTTAEKAARYFTQAATVLMDSLLTSRGSHGGQKPHKEPPLYSQRTDHRAYLKQPGSLAPTVANERSIGKVFLCNSARATHNHSEGSVGHPVTKTAQGTKNESSDKTPEELATRSNLGEETLRTAWCTEHPLGKAVDTDLELCCSNNKTDKDPNMPGKLETDRRERGSHVSTTLSKRRDVRDLDSGTPLERPQIPLLNLTKSACSPFSKLTRTARHRDFNTARHRLGCRTERTYLPQIHPVSTVASKAKNVFQFGCLSDRYMMNLAQT